MNKQNAHKITMIKEFSMIYNHDNKFMIFITFNCDLQPI